MRPLELEIQEAESMENRFWRCLEPCRYPLYAFIRKALNYSEDAEDLFQDTVLRARRYFSAYDGVSPFRSWIYTIAHNELKKYRMRVNRSPGELPDDHEIGLQAQGLDPHDLELARRLHGLARQLKPAWREVFLLYYNDGFNAAEVAAITGRSHVNVRFMLHRSRQRIRTLMGVGNEKK